MGCSEKNKAMTSQSTSPLPPVINWTWRIIVALPIEIGDFEHSYVNWSECQMVKLSGTIQEKTSHHLPNMMAYQGFVYSAWLFINNKFLRIGQHESPTCSCLLIYVGLNSLRDLAIQQFFSKHIFLCLPYLFILYPLQDKICYMLPVLRLLIPHPEKSWPLHPSPRELIGQAPTWWPHRRDLHSRSKLI